MNESTTVMRKQLLENVIAQRKAFLNTIVPWACEMVRRSSNPTNHSWPSKDDWNQEYVCLGNFCLRHFHNTLGLPNLTSNELHIETLPYGLHVAVVTWLSRGGYAFDADECCKVTYHARGNWEDDLLEVYSNWEYYENKAVAKDAATKLAEEIHKLDRDAKRLGISITP